MYQFSYKTLFKNKNKNYKILNNKTRSLFNDKIVLKSCVSNITLSSSLFFLV